MNDEGKEVAFVLDISLRENFSNAIDFAFSFFKKHKGRRVEIFFIAMDLELYEVCYWLNPRSIPESNSNEKIRGGCKYDGEIARFTYPNYQSSNSLYLDRVFSMCCTGNKSVRCALYGGSPQYWQQLVYSGMIDDNLLSEKDRLWIEFKQILHATNNEELVKLSLTRCDISDENDLEDSRYREVLYTTQFLSKESLVKLHSMSLKQRKMSMFLLCKKNPLRQTEFDDYELLRHLFYHFRELITNESQSNIEAVDGFMDRLFVFAADFAWIMSLRALEMCNEFLNLSDFDTEPWSTLRLDFKMCDRIENIQRLVEVGVKIPPLNECLENFNIEMREKFVEIAGEFDSTEFSERSLEMLAEIQKRKLLKLKQRASDV